MNLRKRQVEMGWICRGEEEVRESVQERLIRIHSVCIWNCQVKLINKERRNFSYISFKTLQPNFSKFMHIVIPHISKCPQRWLVSSRLSWIMLQGLTWSRYRVQIPRPFILRGRGWNVLTLQGPRKRYCKNHDFFLNAEGNIHIGGAKRICF